MNLAIVLPNREVEDFVWTWQSECLVRDETLALLRANGLTGFEVKPVTARFLTLTREPPKLWELVLTGWAGLAKAESGIKFDELKSCSICGQLRYTGLQNADELIDGAKWDNTDFFMVWPMPRYVFVTERVVSIIRKNNLTGVEIIPVPKLRPTEGFTPGRLSYWMPENRAQELGKPLEIY